MDLDPYSLCPCGSGKKVKFCCNEIVEDMQRILSMRQNNQLHMALQSLSKLRSSLKAGHPGEIWVRTTEATILLEDNQLDLAKKAVSEALEAIPDNPQLLALSALTSLIADGYEASKAIVDQALQHASDQRNLISHVVSLLADHFMNENKVMAVRQHLALAIRLAADPAPMVERLAGFDRDQSLPFWLRSDYFLKSVDIPEDRQADYARAVDLESCGCYQLAANAFEALANKDPENSDLWYNTALCLAWSGDVQGAIEAFGEAACTQKKFEDAVECETLCQMLELTDPEEGVDVSRSLFRAGSVAKLLTNWQDAEQIVRDEESGQELPPNIAGVFHILDRPQVPVEDSADFAEETIPNIIGDITVFAGEEKSSERSMVILDYYGKEPVADVIQLILESSQNELEQEGETEVHSKIPAEIQDLHHNWYFPASTPVYLMHKLEQERWQRILQDVWPNMPLAALDGKTPLEAVGDEEFQIELAAAVNSLDAICDQRGYFFELKPLRERLKVAQPEPITIDEQTVLAIFPLPRLQRIALEQLNDEQLVRVLQRSLLTHVSSLCYAVFKETVNRPQVVSDEETSSLYSGLVGLCRNQYNRDEALNWIAKGREFDAQRNEPLEKLVTWDLREASVRSWDPNDPEGRELLLRLWQQTSIKLPYLKTVLEQLVETTGIEPPWSGSVIQTSETAGTSSAGVWTPGSQPAEEKSKLWIPGQD